MTVVAEWHDFYLMAGGAMAALTGLLFVAMSIHLQEILAIRPLTRNVAVALYGVLFQIAFCGLMLAPHVTLPEAGVTVVGGSVVFAGASVYVGSHRSRADTAINAGVGLVSAGIGALMIVNWSPALYLYAFVVGGSVVALVRLCWRLLTMAVVGLREERGRAGDVMRRVSSR